MSVKLLRNYEISDTIFLPLVTDSLHRTISVHMNEKETNKQRVKKKKKREHKKGLE